MTITNTNNNIIDPLNWCLIQYLIGLDINKNYECIDDCFRLLLKQYILFFEINSISSRDKKRLLIEFKQLQNQFIAQQPLIENILMEQMDYKPTDDLIYRSLQVFSFHWVVNQKDISEKILQFIEDNNFSLFLFSQSIMKNLLQKNYHKKSLDMEL